RLLPYWMLYVGAIATFMFVVETRAYRREPARALQRDKAEVVPLAIEGKRNILFLGAIVGAVLLPAGFREATMAAIALASYFTTPHAVHEKNTFSFGPIVEVCVLFAGLFACLAPIEVNLAHAAPDLPIQHAWQLFWCSGFLSSLLDNAPTYAAFA